MPAPDGFVVIGILAALVVGGLLALDFDGLKGLEWIHKGLGVLAAGAFAANVATAHQAQMQQDAVCNFREQLGNPCTSITIYKAPTDDPGSFKYQAVELVYILVAVGVGYLVVFALVQLIRAIRHTSEPQAPK